MRRSGLLVKDRQLTIAAMEAGPTLEEPELLSLPDNAMFKSSDTGALDCHWTQRWSGKQESLKCNTWTS